MTKGEKISKFEACPGLDPGFHVRHSSLTILGTHSSKRKPQREFNIHSLLSALLGSPSCRAVALAEAEALAKAAALCVIL